MTAEEIITTTCAPHCGGGCLLKVHVKDGVITRIEADDDSENTQVRACLRGRSWRQRIYHPDREAFRRDGFHKIDLPEPNVPFRAQIEDPENNPFYTPSSKIEIYSQTIADMNMPNCPPIPKYIEPWEGLNDPLAEKYPLQLITTHTKRRAHTQFDNIPWLREMDPHSIRMNPIDAEIRGIKDGDMVRVFNDRGTIVVPTKIVETIMPGVVDLPQGAWYAPDENGIDRGGCANVLSIDKPSPGGALPSNTGLVQITKT